MPDIGAHAQECKFYNCTHLHEPGCAVMPRVEDEETGMDADHDISANRYYIYAELFDELSQAQNY